MGFGLGVSPEQRATEARVEEEMYGLITQLTNEINWHMRERGLSRADLAARMGVSPGRISQILGGGENLTLRTLAALATALDARFGIELSSLKAEDAFTSRGAADAEATPPRSAANHHALPRSRHHESAREGTRDSGGPRHP
jgi:transcriptional regulator with XRE-family HTH domain